MHEVEQSMFRKEYSEVFQGDAAWQHIPTTASNTYQWRADSTYVKNPPYFADIKTNTNTCQKY